MTRLFAAPARALAMLLAFVCLCLSCKKDKADNTIPLSATEIGMFAGDTGSISIQAPAGTYSVVSAHENIATAVIDGNRINVTTRETGNTVLTVTDNARNRTAQIKVYANNMNGAWRWRTADPAEKPDVIVTATDAAFAAQLQAEVLALTASPGYDMYMLNFGNGTFEERKATNNIEPVTLTGTFRYQLLTLTMVYPAGEEVWKIKSLPQNRLALERDMTAHYQQLYPDKGILKVVVVKYLQRIMTYG